MPESRTEQRPRFYICPTCFAVAYEPIEGHPHPMVPCNAERIEDCKPLMTNDGQLRSRAPRWFIKEIDKLRD